MLQEAIERRPDPIDREGARAHAEGERNGGQEGVPDDALAGMLADGGGDVDRGIGVMHAMVAPERRHPVHGDMGHVEGQVERQDADDA